ncbi:MAG: SH3 domain-containing protein [Anaerolineales bacterium]|nr:SH3 domain-containing protein [Anaerolineales bacterium]
MKKSLLFPVLFLVLAMLACNLPGNTPTESPTAVIEYSATPSFTPIPELPSATPVPSSTACSPTVTTNTVANVRSGPGQVYGIIGAIPLGGTAAVDGKSYDGGWWYIQFAGGESGHAWISNTVTTANCIPDSLALIVAPPTPVLPTATPTLVPSVTPTPGLIIVLPPIFLINTHTPTPTPKFFIPPIIINP